MVQVISDPYAKGNIFGRLGATLGEGLSKGATESIKRGITGSALERLSEQKNLNPLQQASALLKTGAIEPSEAFQFLPYLQQAQKTQALKEGTRQKLLAPQSPKNIQEKREQVEKPGFESDWENYLQSKIQPPTREQELNLAAKYVQNGITDPQEAENLAVQDLKRNYESQEEKISNLRTRINDRMTRELQGSGLNDYKDLQGEITQRFLQKAELEVFKNGKSLDQVENEISNQIKELGKIAAQTKATGAKSIFTAKPRDKIAAYKQQLKAYKDQGFEDLFNDIVSSSENITPLESASFLFPIENKKINSELKKANSFLGKLKRSPFKEVTELDDKSLNNIIDSIKPNDNILSIAYEFRKSGLDVSQLIEALRKKSENLTNDQKRQLNKPISNSIFGDILFEALR